MNNNTMSYKKPQTAIHKDKKKTNSIKQQIQPKNISLKTNPKKIELNHPSAESPSNQIYFKNTLNYEINKTGFLVRLIICSLGITIIGINSFTNFMITDEESEGIKDKLVEFLSFYTYFLHNNLNSYSKFINIAVAIFYDVFIFVGILIWIIKSKSAKLPYAVVLFFGLMIFMQNIFHMEMPLFKDAEFKAYDIKVNSIFLTLPINKTSYFSGQVGFLLIFIMEFLEHGMTSLFICGVIYLINLIAYLLAIHHSNTLSVTSSIMAALYFEKISLEILSHRFNLMDYLMKIVKNFMLSFFAKEKKESKAKFNNEDNDNDNDNDNDDEYEKLNNENYKGSCTNKKKRNLLENNDYDNVNDTISGIHRKSTSLSESNFLKYKKFEKKNKGDNDNDNDDIKIVRENYLTDNLEFLIKNQQRNNPKERFKSNKN